jgi:hypothetical protein
MSKNAQFLPARSSENTLDPVTILAQIIRIAATHKLRQQPLDNIHSSGYRIIFTTIVQTGTDHIQATRIFFTPNAHHHILLNFVHR